MEQDSGTISELLRAHAAGDEPVVDRLFPVFYEELKGLAHRQLARGGRGVKRTLNTTALVHEAYLKLGTAGSPANRAHFFALAARAMRQIIVDRARFYLADKRGGGARPVSLHESQIPVTEEADELVAIDTALVRLGELDPRLARVVECRFFAGLTEEETAEALGTSLRTVQRDWMRARGWLRIDLDREDLD